MKIRAIVLSVLMLLATLSTPVVADTPETSIQSSENITTEATFTQQDGPTSTLPVVQDGDPAEQIEVRGVSSNVGTQTTSQNGTLNWSKTYETNQTGSGKFGEVIRTDDGGVAITGFTDANTSNFSSEVNVTVVKAAADGTKQWISTVDVGQVDDGKTLIQTQDGGFVTGGIDAFLKLDNTGSVVWTRADDISGFTFRSVVESTNGDLTAVSNTCCSDDRQSIFVRTNASGVEQWNQTVSVTDGANDYLSYEGTEISDGVVFGVTGQATQNAYLYALTDDGTHQWTRKFNNTSIESVTTLSDGDILVSGTDHQQNSLRLVRISENNTIHWDRTYDPTKPITAAETEQGNISVLTHGKQMLKLSSAGDQLEVRNYPVPENATIGSAVRVGEWQYILGGEKGPSRAETKFWLAKVTGETVNDSSESASPLNLTGSVKAADGSIPSGHVELHGRLGASDTDESTPGSDGEYNLTGATGTYQVSFVQQSSPVDNVPDIYPLHRVYFTEPQHLGSDTLPTASRLNVTVVDQQNDPVDSATVVIAYGDNRVYESISGTTTPTGEFVFGQTPGVEVAGPEAIPNEYGGNVQVQVYGPNDTFVGTRLSVSNDTNITLQLKNKTSVSGAITRPSGDAAVNRTAVVLGDTNGTAGGGFGRTNATGNFSTTVAVNGTYNVKFRQERYSEAGTSFPADSVPDVYAVTQLNVGTAPADVGSVSLPSAHRLNISVVDSNSNPVENARVTIDHRNGGSVGFVSGSTLANGTMVLDATGKKGVDLVGDLQITVDGPPNSTSLDGEETTKTLTLDSDRNLEIQLGANDTQETTLTNSSVHAVASSSSIEAGETTTVDIVASNVSEGVGAFSTTLSLANESVGTIDEVTILGSPNSSDVVRNTTNTSISIDAFGLNRTPDSSGDVVLAQVNVTLDTSGSTEVVVSESVLGSASGDDYTVVSETGTTLTATTLSPLGNSTAPPADVDGDGTFEDINGDGNVTISDVQAMFANRNSDTVQTNVDKFDFTDNSEVNIVDIQQLFVEVTS
ncbi:hypothetical protein [Haloferax profundi]|uniref:Dockerin domain-containing protein n=1 Tax=Haloferax profundi TaxID=1544718 RepID=A0A0W1RXS8_9EURY|nr:hypothetical protein [Haloferax profundi]KTG18519.1 hypothetical protein AUR66_18240 [Haloferax profundi]